MGISRIQITNFKSIKSMIFNVQNNYDLQCLIGKNGVGKSTFLDAINYFSEMLIGNDNMKNIIDSANVYIQYAEIEVEYDLNFINRHSIYYNNKLSELDDLQNDGKIRIKMRQYKDGTIKWYPKEITKDIRILIQKISPVYIINTRFISLNDWAYLWDIIADLSVGLIKYGDKKIQEKFDEVFKDFYGEKYIRTISKLNQIFDSEDINNNSESYKEKYKNALIMRYGGKSFMNNENYLTYNSDGINSLKFLKLVIILICELSKDCMKNPLLLIDEPEIGLHAQYLEELVMCFEQNINSSINVILATHSSHLVSEMIKNEMKIAIWRVYSDQNYARFEKLKDILDEKQKYLVSDTETNCYFAKAILFVEGKSEIQLFKNKRIIELYPEMKSIYVLNYDSDNATLKIVYPNETKSTISYITMVDMDKILVYSYKDRKFKVKSDGLINPLSSVNLANREKFYYHTKYNGNKKNRTYFERTKIKSFLESVEFRFTKEKFWLDDKKFDQLIYRVKDYCQNYNVLPLKNTLEGGIVNSENIDSIINWLESKLKNDNDFKELKKILNSLLVEKNNFSITVLRLILNGKMDNLKNLGEDDFKINDNISKIIENLKQKVGKKTGGWIGEYLEYYFCNVIDLIQEPELKRKEFKKDFVEIDYVIRQCAKMI